MKLMRIVILNDRLDLVETNSAFYAFAVNYVY